MLSAVVVVGRERDERDRLAMSALRPEADIWAGLQHVCFVINGPCGLRSSSSKIKGKQMRQPCQGYL